jgi:NAD-dependent deacetylase
MNQEDIAFCLPLLKQAENVVVFTGAGVSAESGIPTFRDALTGLWAKHDPMDLATPEAFARDPDLVWSWYEWRRWQVHRTNPNCAHNAIAQLESLVPRLTLITQNVDDLHERAGSSNVIHLHGDLQSARCSVCAAPHGLDAEQWLESPQENRSISPPRCLRCNNPVRPGVVWFGESLPERAFQQAFDAAGDCDLVLSIGTSGVVQPAALIPDIALKNGASVVHINPQPVLSHPRESSIQGPAAEILPILLRDAFG